jgi:hypothetical protein
MVPHSIGGFFMAVGVFLIALLFVGLIPASWIGSKGLV